MFHLTRGLSRKGHDVSLLTGKRPFDRQPRGTPLAAFTEQIETFPVDSPTSWWSWFRKLLSLRPYPAPLFANASYRSRLARLLAEDHPDLIFTNFLFMADGVSKTANTDVEVVLDQHEDELRHWRGYLSDGRLHERVFAGLTLAKVRRFQRRVFAEMDAIATASRGEADDVRRRTGRQASVWIVPNGVDVEKYGGLPVPPDDSADLLFVGGMGVERNADAVRWFVEEIFPRVRSRHPSARFLIVGSSPLPGVKKLEKKDGVVVTGTVPDVRPYYERASVAVVPQRFGAGTKLKVLEAMAAGRPLVTTSNGVQGLDLEPDEHVVLADRPDAFGAKVSDLLDNPRRARELARRAKAKVRKDYSWTRIVDQLDEKIRLLVRN